MIRTPDPAAYRGRSILVTGATGLIGRALVPRLIAMGARVRTAGTRDAPFPDHHRGDLRDPGFAQGLMAGIDGLFHLAGLRGTVAMQRARGADLLATNTLICFQVLEAARRAAVERLVYASTVTVYPPLPEYREDLAWSANPAPSTEFVAWAKRMAEKLIEAQAVQEGRDNAAILRLVNTFGPHDDFNPATALVVPALIARAEAGEDPFTVWGDGRAERDFLYVEDAVDGLLLGFEHGIGKGPVNLGSGQGTTIREVVGMVLAAAGRAPDVRWDAGRPSGEPRKVADPARCRAILGFRPRIGLAEGIARTLAWYRANRAVVS